MPERTSAIPAWAWIVGAVLAIVSIFAGYRMVQTQQHLVAAQSELESAKQAVEKANAERNELQTKLEDATSEVRSAQSRLAETQPVLEAAQSELERATQAAEKANAGRTEIQIKLDEAASETNQSNPGLPRRSLVWKQRKANLRAPSKQPNRQKRKSRSLSKRRPVSNQSCKRPMASALSSSNLMRDRRLSGLKVSSKKPRAPKVHEAAVEISQLLGTKQTYNSVVTKSASGPKRTNRPFQSAPIEIKLMSMRPFLAA